MKSAMRLPRANGARIPAAETEAALRTRRRIRSARNSTPTRNMYTASPSWATAKMMVMDDAVILTGS